MSEEICDGNNKKLCRLEKCQDCYEKSFASHPRSKNWSKKNKLSPREVFKSSDKKYMFDCDVCLHEFKNRPKHANNGNWCPHCKNKTELKLYNYLLSTYPDLKIICQAKFDFYKNPETNRHFPFDFYIKNIN